VRVRRALPQEVLGVVLVATVALGASGCSAATPSATARSLCSTVKKAVDVPQGWTTFIDPVEFKSDEHTGDAGLDRAARALVTGRDVNGSRAEVETACRRLGIW
jgi:hypothetical protein